MNYTPTLADDICARISTGNSLASICRILKIDYSTVFDWLDKYEEFANNYARAREAQADYHADQIIDIADTEDDANKARVRIDARKWVAGKMKPKKYGDKQLGDADNPVNVIGVLKWKDE